MGVLSNNQAEHILTGYGAITVYGWYLDGAGVSTRLDRDTYSDNATGSRTSWGAFCNSCVDYMVTGFEAAGANHGIGIAGTPQDFFFRDSTLDTLSTDCINTNPTGSLVATIKASSIQGGECNSTGTYGANIDGGSSTFQLQGMRFLVSGTTAAIRLHSSLSAVQGNSIYTRSNAGSVGILVDGSAFANISGNKVDNSAGSTTSVPYKFINSSSGNTFMDNTAKSTSVVSTAAGISFDATSCSNVAYNLNIYDGGAFTGNGGVPLDSCGSNGLSTGSTVNVNGSSVASPNFNGSSPSPDASFAANTFKVSSSDVISETHFADTSHFGVLKVDGTSCTTTAGVLTCPGGTGATSVPICSDSSGSGTVQSCTTSPSFTPSAGTVIAYTTTTANTGAGLTLNVNSLGAKSVAKWQGTTTLVANDMLAGKYVLMTYDGTNWEMSTIGNAPSGGGSSNWVNIGSAVTFTGSGSMVGSFASGAYTVSTAGTILTITSIPGTYLNLILKVKGTTASSNNITVQFNGDTGSHYTWSGLQSPVSSITTFSSIGAGTASTSIANAILLGTLSAQGTMEIDGYADTFPKVVDVSGSYWSSLGTTTNDQQYRMLALWDSTGSGSRPAITSITLTCASNCSIGDQFMLYATN